MNLTPEQKADRDKVVADLTALVDEKFAALYPVAVEDTKSWPQVGDKILTITGSGELIRDIWTNDEVQTDALAIGNVYRQEHSAYAKRHVEAMNVQAELRRMPGACAPSHGETFYIGSDPTADQIPFGVHFLNESSSACNALGGVHFSGSNFVFSAINTITPARLALLRDDYLQVPIEGVV